MTTFGSGSPGMVKKVTKSTRPHLNVSDIRPIDKHKLLQDQILRLRDEIAELILLESTPIAVSVYEMAYEQYMDLPGDIRL